MDSNLVNNNFSVNLETLRNCFQLVGRKDQQNQQMIMEAQKYIEECKKDRQFPAILLMTFDNQEEEAQIRLLSIIEFKNMVKDNWVIRKTSKSTSVYPDQDKKEIRTTLLNFLDKYQDKTSRSQINDILKIISFTDFPTQFGELVQYFLDNMQGLRQTLTDHSMLLSDVTLNFVKTLKIIMTERSRKRIGDFRNLFFNVYLKLMEAFHEFWDYFHVNMGSLVGAANSQNFNQIQRFISLARKSDNIYISFLCNGCEEMVESENIVKIASLIVQRAAELTEMVKNLKGNKALVDVYQELNKNLYKYLYSLSQLQAIFPLVFKDVITNYVKLIEFIIDNPESFDNEYVLRAAIICLNSALRRYSYHGDDISVKRQSQIGNYEEIKKQCIIEFYSYFSLEKIENFFNIFLLKLLPRRPVLTGEQDSNSLDEFVEIENDNFTSDFEKLETPIYNLTLKCTSELLIRFPEQAIPLIHGLANKVVNNELSSLPPIIQDGIFAMIGQLPDVYQQKKINADNYLDLGSVLKYLEERAGSDLNLSKRIPVLIHKWMSLFNAGVKAQIVQNVVQITQSLQNYVVRYECCMCLKVILKSPEVLEIDYAAISEHLVPIIIDLLGRFRNPQATWGLIEVLKLLFTKAQYSAQNDNIIAQLQSQNIQVLTKIDDPLLLPALVDMFKTVIASFPFGTCLTSIFKICIDYVDFHFKENRFRPALLSLWLFLAREYHEIQDVGQAMKTMFGRYSESLLGMNNPDELSKFINIIEEYILAELISPDDYLSIIKIMEDKTEITFKVSVTTENIYNLKSALLSLMSTLVLIVLRQNNMENLKIFNKMLAFLLRDLLNNFFDPAFRSLKAFKMSMLTLINRFIILNTQGVLEMLEKFQVGFNNFLGEWINNMNFLLSNQTRRINAVAVMTLLPYINDKELLGECLDDLLKHTMPELRRILDGDDKPPVLHDQKPLGTRERCEDIRDSERKKVIRQDALYYDVDLRDLFVKTFRDAIARNNFSLDDLRACVKDATVLEEFLSLIN